MAFRLGKNISKCMSRLFLITNATVEIFAALCIAPKIRSSLG